MNKRRIGRTIRGQERAARKQSTGSVRCHEPDHAVFNTAFWQGGRCAPLRPPASRTAAGTASGRGRRPRTPSPVRPPADRRPVIGRRPRQRLAEDAASGNEAGGGRPWRGREHGSPRHRPLSASAAAKPRATGKRPEPALAPGEHALRSGARTFLGDRRGGVPRQPQCHTWGSLA